jgi:predicted transposase YbfD/YdcC
MDVDEPLDLSLIAIFRDLPDPRINRRKLHNLEDIMTIAILAVLSGADHWTEIEDYGRSKQAWLRTFLELPNGIPSHDTFGRVFALLDPAAFRESFARWIEAMRTRLVRVSADRQVAIDGKTSRRTGSRSAGLGPLHLVSAWSVEHGVVLGQVATDQKSNEITAIPKVLDLINITGCIVTIDALGCQHKIVEKILARGGQYVLAVKENQPELEQDIREYFEWAERAAVFERPEIETSETITREHGREERRVASVSTEVEWLRGYGKKWKGVASVVQIEAWRKEAGKAESYERRYYLSSVAGEAGRLNRIIRNHWGIENGLHWCLDIAFREDDSRVRTGHAAENFAILRHLAMNLLKQETTCKLGIKSKRRKMSWDDTYLLKVLGV